jgi:hypothetical protein
MTDILGTVHHLKLQQSYSILKIACLHAQMEKEEGECTVCGLSERSLWFQPSRLSLIPHHLKMETKPISTTPQTTGNIQNISHV